MLKQKSRNSFIFTFIIANGDIITIYECRLKSHEDNNMLSRESQAYSFIFFSSELVGHREPTWIHIKEYFLNFDYQALNVLFWSWILIFVVPPFKNHVRN